MKGLIVIGTTIVGAGVGCWGGFIGALFFADMDIGKMDAVGYIVGGTIAGAMGGAYVGGQIVAR